MMAPAPTRSSKATRNDLSSHCSPAGTMEIFLPKLPANFATAFAFRKLPHIVGVVPVAKVNVEPLGEGKTSFVPGLILSNDVGESEYPPENFLWRSASSAS